MKGSLRWRIGLTLFVALLAIIYVLPTLPGVKESALGRFLPDEKINLGLDLQGGIHLTLGVDIDKAMENKLAQLGADIRSMAREEKVAVTRPEVRGEDIIFTLLKVDQKERMDKLLEDDLGTVLEVDSVKQLPEDKVEYVLAMTSGYRKFFADMTLDQAVKTIRNRIDEFGVTEPDIRKQEGHRIQVQLPGLKDPDRAIQILRRTAHLEFKIVEEGVDMEKAKKGVLPPGCELSALLRPNVDGTYTETPIVLRKDAAMTGENIEDAHTTFDSFNQPSIAMSFNARGAREFERVTSENVKKQMAIVLDGKVYSAPTIQEKISGGRASITGRFTQDEARDLAIVLRAGALPAPVTVLEQRTVGPTLGQESIDAGLNSALIGLAVVVAFMVVYYAFAGLVADFVLMLNILLIMAGLAGFGATLTLPGIAGIILTIGMAVDANVLIFERIREELKNGRTPRAALEEGYNRATLTIFDANITTIIAAVILYQFGTGPIRGFAVTLSLGIVASMFTAIFVSRILFDLWLSRKPGAQLSI